jgi:hypothetical protein
MSTDLYFPAVQQPSLACETKGHAIRWNRQRSQLHVVVAVEPFFANAREAGQTVTPRVSVVPRRGTELVSSSHRSYAP